MKIKLLITLCLLVGTGFAQKITNSVKSDKTSVTLTEDENRYELKAEYNDELTNKIRSYMDDCITRGTGFSFKNTQLDADMTLSNHISFYIKTSAGKLNLKFDKRKNSAELYNRFKKMCEGIRDITQKK
jgi:hypothetical protein